MSRPDTTQSARCSRRTALGLIEGLADARTRSEANRARIRAIDAQIARLSEQFQAELSGQNARPVVTAVSGQAWIREASAPDTDRFLDLTVVDRLRPELDRVGCGWLLDQPEVQDLVWECGTGREALIAELHERADRAVQDWLPELGSADRDEYRTVQRHVLAMKLAAGALNQT